MYIDMNGFTATKDNKDGNQQQSIKHSDTIHSDQSSLLAIPQPTLPLMSK